MSTAKYIKGFCIGRQSDSKILYKINRIPSEPAVQLSSYQSIFEYQKGQDEEDYVAKNIQRYFKVDEEQKQFEINKTLETQAPEGMYYTLIDDKSIVYSTLLNEIYPSKQAQIMLNTIRKELKNMPNYEKQSEKTIQNFAKGFIVKIIDQYDTEEIVQEALKAAKEQKQIEIEDLHIQIEHNLKLMHTDHSHPSNFSTADQKLSPEIEQLRQQNENAKEEKAKTKEQNKEETLQLQRKQLKNAVAVRNLKIKIIVAIVVISIVLYLVIPLF